MILFWLTLVGLLFLRIDRALQFVLLSLTMLFFSLAARDLPGQRHNIIFGLSVPFTPVWPGPQRGLQESCSTTRPSLKKPVKSGRFIFPIYVLFLSTKLQKG